MDTILQNLVNADQEFKLWLYVASICTLVPLGFLQSMKQISYISIVAVGSICVALIYILYTDLLEISNPLFDKTYIFIDMSGIPYFFGIASFMYEGNALALEIYQ